MKKPWTVTPSLRVRARAPKAKALAPWPFVAARRCGILKRVVTAPIYDFHSVPVAGDI